MLFSFPEARDMPETGLLQRMLFPLASRFVAGDSAADALEAVRRLNEAGMAAAIDVLGEDVRDARAAARIRDEYVALIGKVAAAGLNANLSLKLSALGMLVEPALARANFMVVLDVAAASLRDSFVRIDMEGTALLERTLALFRDVFETRKNTGIVLQAYLRRTPADVEEMIVLGARVRFCKGAYKEPAALAISGTPAIRAQFLACAQRLLTSGHYPAIATHDPYVIDALKAFTRANAIGNDAFEFQILYGVRADLQRQLVADGYRVRVYVPYGTHWAKYLRRRITERRENVVFALRSFTGAR